MKFLILLIIIMKGTKMTIDEIKTQVDKKVQESIQLALAVTEKETDENKRNLIIVGAQAKGLSNAIEYLYTVIEPLL